MRRYLALISHGEFTMPIIVCIESTAAKARDPVLVERSLRNPEAASAIHCMQRSAAREERSRLMGARGSVTSGCWSVRWKLTSECARPLIQHVKLLQQ
ncbi:hypothetical protein NDU88_002937 [Pleurodeles waltl]|uniref:Uncharacterized protein n=1 Tax=Pleurodeles waltl TaxID=8319 RepID=A0AAV7SFB4_PLEWA|nr:hypothetical protein NDU88_002937 [Pleurodeles waltl]